MPAGLVVLDGLKPVHAVRDFYLAGGTALALRHGHRRSIDFDFFRVTPFDVQGLLVTLEDAFGPLERLPTGDDNLYVRPLGVTASFFRYPYRLLAPVEPTRTSGCWRRRSRRE